MDLAQLDLINSNLKRYFGVSPGDRPNFRLVWSDDIIEKVYDKFNEFSGPIYLRTVKEVREKRKYFWPGARSKWILEQYWRGMPDPALTADPDGHYEPLFIYPIAPTWKAIEFLMMVKFRGPEHVSKVTDEEETEKMLNYYSDIIEQSSSHVEMKLNLGQGVVVPSTYESQVG